jgi:FkbM family methyltransferase
MIPCERKARYKLLDFPCQTPGGGRLAAILRSGRGLRERVALPKGANWGNFASKSEAIRRIPVKDGLRIRAAIDVGINQMRDTENGESPYQLVSARHGRFLVNRNDKYIGQSLIQYGEFAEDEVRILGKLLRIGDHIVEIGANIGAISIPLSNVIGDAGRMHVFEPQRLVFQLLCANAALNDRFNFYPYNFGISEQPSTLTIPCPDPRRKLNFGAVTFNCEIVYSDTSELVPSEQSHTVTLDELVSEKIQRVDLIKIDAEEFSMSALRSASNTIGKHKPAIFCELSDRNPAECDEIRDFFSSRGYDAYLCCTSLFNKYNVRSNEAYIWIADGVLVVSLDVIALPQGLREIEGLPLLKSKDQLRNPQPANPDHCHFRKL